MSKGIVFVALLAGGLGWLTATWAAELSGELKDRNSIARNGDLRLGLAKQGFDLSLHRYLKRIGSATSDEVAKWSKRVLEAQRSLRTEPELQLLEQHRDRMLRLQRLALSRHRDSGGGFEKLDIEEAQYLLVEADCWLSAAKAGND